MSPSVTGCVCAGRSAPAYGRVRMRPWARSGGRFPGCFLEELKVCTAEEAALRQAAVIRGMIYDLGRTIYILNIDILTEEESVRVFDRSDPAYSILARMLTARRDNLVVTVADLEERLHAIPAAIPAVVPEAA